VSLHAAYAPTFGIKPGDPVVFRSRGFGAGAGNDVFDFGDGTPPVPVPSNIDSAQHAANGYGAVIHHYRQPGHYIVKVERKDEATGHVAMQHLRVLGGENHERRPGVPVVVAGRVCKRVGERREYVFCILGVTVHVERAGYGNHGHGAIADRAPAFRMQRAEGVIPKATDASSGASSPSSK
jgi:hypothetical protein